MAIAEALERLILAHVLDAQDLGLCLDIPDEVVDVGLGQPIVELGHDLDLLLDELQARR